MEELELSRAATIVDPDAARIFINSRLRRILMLFATREISIGEAARLGNVELKRLHQYVGRMVDLGLLKVVGQRRRAGRPIKLYTAIAPSFFVPQEALPRSSTDGLASELRQLLAAEERKSIAGILVGLGSDGEPQVRIIPNDRSTQRTFELWRILRLSSDDFTAMRAELDAVIRRFQQRPAKRGQVYLIHASGAPRADQTGVLDNRAVN